MKWLLKIGTVLGFAGLLGGQVSLAQAPASSTGTNLPEAELVRRLEELFEKARFAEAIPLAKELVSRSEREYGASHTNTADALYVLGVIYEKTSNYTNSAALHERALKMREATLGPEHPHTALSLDHLAVVYYKTGDYAKAKPLFERSLKIVEKVFGPEHREVAAVLNNLASLHEKTRDYAKAESMYLRSLKICERAFGAEQMHTAAVLNNFAGLYQGMGDYSKAELLLVRSLKIHEKVFGPEHLDTAATRNHLAVQYLRMGDYAKAEPLLEWSLKTREKAFGPEHPVTAEALNNMAVLYLSMGDYSKAEPLLQRSLKMRETVFSPEHPDTANSLNNLAHLHQKMGAYAKAVALLDRSLKIHETVLGREHRDTATALNNLAEHYRHTGDYAKAEPLHLRCLKIRETVFGPEHPDTATSLDNLAWLYRMMGDYTKGELLAEQSLAIYEKVLGPDHPDTAIAQANLSLLKLDLGKVNEALSLGRKCKLSSERGLGHILAFTSERQRMSHQGNKSSYEGEILATLGSAADLAESILRTKGVVLDSLLEDELAALASKDPAVKAAWDELQTARRHLTKLQIESLADVSPAGLGKRREELARLEQQVESLQKSLARNVTSLGQVRRALRVTVPEVQAVLTQDAMLLEFIRYPHYLGNGRFEPRYGAVLMGNASVALKGAKPGEPVWVPLGSAEAIERNLQEYGAMMRGVKRGEPSLLHRLYKQLFSPIQLRLSRGITTLIISPDAELNFISFATLVDTQEKFLAEQYTLLHVASGRDLVFGRTGQAVSRQLAAFGNPAFGEQPAASGTRETNAVQLVMRSLDRRDYAGITLEALPNTAQEVQFLRERSPTWKLNGTVSVGAAATEAEVKAVKSPHILHLATHGFFLPDTLPTNRPSMGMQLLGEPQAPVVFRNPMQRSGLAFSGAQITLDAWKRGETPETGNDGILMAQEVGTMDLKATWLVVLSACDTGVGEARAGEGVLGLRRGFIQAGTENLLLTLWPVSDRWTLEMMKAFYERALRDLDAPRALAAVQREFLLKLREEKNAVMAARLAGPFVMTFQGALKLKPPVPWTIALLNKFWSVDEEKPPQTWTSKDGKLRVESGLVAPSEACGEGMVSFSKTGQHLVFATQLERNWLVCHDNSVLAPLPNCAAVTNVVISDDGSAYAFAKLGPEGWQMVHAATEKKQWETGPPFQGFFSGTLILSPDGKRFSYVVVRGGKKLVLLDGKPSKLWENLGEGSFRFSQDGKRFAYRAGDLTGQYVLSDGQSYGPFEGVSCIEFSLDSRRLAFGVQDKSAWHMIVDGKKSKPYLEAVNSPVFSPDGKRLAFVTVKNDALVLVLDDQEVDLLGRGLKLTKEAPLAFSPQGDHFGYVCVRKDQKQCVVLDGKEQSAHGAIDAGPRFSPDGRLVYVAVESQEQYVVIGGVQGPRYTGIIKHGVVFNSDGRRFAYGATRGDKWFMVIDGVEGPALMDGIAKAAYSFQADGSITVLGSYSGNLYSFRHVLTTAQ